MASPFKVPQNHTIASYRPLARTRSTGELGPRVTTSSPSDTRPDKASFATKDKTSPLNFAPSAYLTSQPPPNAAERATSAPNSLNSNRSNSNSNIASSLPHSQSPLAPPPSSPMNNAAAHIHLWFRRNLKLAFLFSVVLIIFLLLSSSPSPPGSYIRGSSNVHGSSYKFFGGAVRPGEFTVESSVISSTEFHVASVADLDKRSKHEGGGKWFSILTPGVLKRKGERYSIDWGEEIKIYTKHNEGGRGMELSELTVYDGRLLSFGDRTGIVFEFLKKDASIKGVPRFILTEGDGETDKGMKVEWSTVKDGKLYIGSFGKEFTNPAGEIINTNNNWIVTMDHQGMMQRYDWSNVYNKVRAAVGCEAPGYLVHEAVLWSESQRRWMFLPRRVSKVAYDDVLDEKKGSNLLIVADDQFRDIKVVTIKLDLAALSDGLHGFSSFAFVPNTGDKHAIATRSVEENCTGDDDDVCHQRSYVTVFDTVTGEVLMQEQPMSDKYKFEGVEFVKI
ncbi:hypothetical protein TrVE_jg5559 [Triparma verrucosa]|uniref:Apyrase n=1 Tax=Triparma verrucosa TaxID=1606542 RepID=A0A9W7B8Q2_9STRA|nr:hypothetical protein TrVE_jg5559 [Triparma verrucosa]